MTNLIGAFDEQALDSYAGVFSLAWSSVISFVNSIDLSLMLSGSVGVASGVQIGCGCGEPFRASAAEGRGSGPHHAERRKILCSWNLRNSMEACQVESAGSSS